MTISALQRLHCEEVSTKWWNRRNACLDDTTRFDWLVELDTGLDANLDGLLEGGELAMEAAAQALAKALRLGVQDVLADCFTQVALMAERDGLDGLLKCAVDPRLIPAIEAYIAWSPTPAASQFAAQCSTHPDAPLYWPALRSLHVHGLSSQDLHRHLNTVSIDHAPQLLSVLANGGALDALGLVLQIVDNPRLPDDSPTRLAAAQCAVLLGAGARALPALRAAALTPGTHQVPACHLLSLCLPAHTLEQHVQCLASGTPSIRPNPLLAIRCVGWGGYIAHVPWLLDRLQEASLISASANAFHHITGLRIEQLLEDSTADGNGPLRSAVHGAMQRWWAKHRDDFTQELPCLLGEPATLDRVNQILVSGTQGARETAALRRMLGVPGSSRFPTCAHVQLQRDRFQVFARH